MNKTPTGIANTGREKKSKLKAYKHFEAQNDVFSHLGKKRTDGNQNGSFLSTKKEDLTKRYALHKMKFLQSLADSIFECSERELSLLWEL